MRSISGWWRAGSRSAPKLAARPASRITSSTFEAGELPCAGRRPGRVDVADVGARLGHARLPGPGRAAPASAPRRSGPRARGRRGGRDARSPRGPEARRRPLAAGRSFAASDRGSRPRARSPASLSSVTRKDAAPAAARAAASSSGVKRSSAAAGARMREAHGARADQRQRRDAAVGRPRRAAARRGRAGRRGRRRRGPDVRL